MSPASRFWHRLHLSDMPPGPRRAAAAGLAVAALLFLGGFVFAGYFWTLVRKFPEAPYPQPSRLYTTPTRLEPGSPVTVPELVSELEAAGYRETRNTTPGPGWYSRKRDGVAVRLRRFPTPDGEAGGLLADIGVSGNRVRSLKADGRKTEAVILEPPLLASFYGPDLNERRPVTLAEMPEFVSQSVLAAEDDNFYAHPGVSPTGIARALWVNLKDGGVAQGGSTITQQLVKNLYLTSKRSLTRKAKEAWIAVLLDLRYSKKSILEAYLNEIYWGKSGPANVIGLGAASWAYFGKHPSQLSLAEAATLAGMIQAPGTYLPTEHPHKAIERRNWVLKRLGELGWVPEEEIRRAQAEPLVVRPETAKARPFAPYFAEMAEHEARERFGVKDLPDEGYILFATIRWRDQRRAEQAVAQGLSGLEKGLERRRGRRSLQGALISVDPRDGAILAYVGGRSYSNSQFDRVRNAHRQAGSAFKPVVYSAAFEEAVVSPASLLKDSPITVKAKGMLWKPQNYDRGFRGMVTVRSALEQSLNIPTVRLALQVGLDRVIDQAKEMGLTTKFDAVPSLALGAFEATPYEMAEVYATFANDGARPELHGLAAVRERDGEEILGDDLPTPRRVMPAEVAYEVTSILQGAMDHGTASPARSYGIRDALAGKTGTTNDRRDNWFAGYSPDRVTVVWVGYDDNSRTNLSGARAALPIWSRFTASVRPSRGYLPFTPPRGMVTVTVDPTTGQLATEACPYRVNEVFPEWQAPSEPCRRHQPGYGQYASYDENGVALDPATGLPVQTDVYQNDEGRIEISNFGYGYGQESGAAGPAVPADTLPDPNADPLTDDVEAEAAPEPTVDPSAGPGIIEIRPTRQHPEPAPEAAAPAAASPTPIVEIKPPAPPASEETPPETPPPPF
ncbi:MAG: PBP1A family penicillin-binding protein [Acidobacteriota bacterium]